ncbi:MAG: methionine--tRNA ligase [archaeon]
MERLDTAPSEKQMAADSGGGSSDGPEKLVVTCALPYADGDIHIGGVTSTYLPADIFVRYQRLLGSSVVFVCASDDYGTPILIAAENQGKQPEEFVSYWNQRFQQDFLGLGIKFDIFDQTSSTENQELTQYFFTKLHEKGFILKREVLEAYCPKCLKFLPDRYVKGRCPYCNAMEQYSDGCEKCGRVFERHQVLDPHCSICGSKPETKSSEHFFFKLSHFSSQLEKWLKGNTNLQSSVRNYVTSWIKEGLKDWDITRDISWGVPIPLDEAQGKVLYGWFDNHLCYISTALKYLEREGRDGKKFWNAAKIYHFIGKDIVYHHYLFLPAIRLGVNEYSLPHFIPTRGHLLLQGEKFSKSRGWGVGLREFLKEFPADYLRFYLASITSYSEVDVNFDWRDFQARINNELVANVGNFIHRTLTFASSRIGEVPSPKDFDSEDRDLLDALSNVAERVGEEISKNELERGLKKILEFSDRCNRYFQKKEPWAESSDPSNCLFLCINAARSLAVMLEPFLPESCERLWNMLALDGSLTENGWNSASEIRMQPGHKIGKPQVLFRKIEDHEIMKQLDRLNLH